MWYIADLRSTPTLTSGAVPPAAVSEKWSKPPSDDSLAVRPGVEIAVELTTSDPHTAKVRDKIVDSLTRRGVNVVADSPIKLIGTIGPGDAKTMNYRTWGGRFGSDTTSVTVQGNVATLSLQVDGQSVWQFHTQTGAPYFVHMKEGESVAQAAQSQANLDSRVFERVWIPVHVPSADPDAENEHSEYPGN